MCVKLYQVEQEMSMYLEVLTTGHKYLKRLHISIIKKIKIKNTLYLKNQ